MATVRQLNLNLIEAAARGDLAAVKRQLQAGADIDAVEEYPFGDVTYPVTALGASAYKGHFTIVKYLVEAGANPYITYNNWTPRGLSLDRKHIDISNYLDKVVRLPKWRNKVDDETGFTPLTCSISLNHEKKMENSFNFGADVCRADRHGKTPLVYAIEKNSMEIVEKLLARGAIATGVSALKCALDLKRNDILKVLISTKDSMIDAFFDDGSTPLTKSISTFNIEIAKCLLEHGADARKVDLNKETPLDKALAINCLEVVELLRSKGANVPKTIEKTAFRKLAQDGEVEPYEFLVRNGWDIDQTDENGKSSLALSASNKYLLLSRFLIEKGARMDLAKREIEAFRQSSMDFDWFVRQFVPEKSVKYEEKWSISGTGQE